MKCPKCNGENPDGSVFCSYCGEKMEVPQVETAPVQEAPVSAPVEPQPVVEQPVVETPVVEQPVQQPVQPQAETVNNNAYSVSPKPKKAKNRLSVLTILACLIGLIVIAGIVLVCIISNPSAKSVYSKMIKEGIYSTVASPAVYADQMSAETSVVFNTDIKDLRDFDNLKVSALTQLDIVNEKVGLNVKFEQDDKTYVDLNAFVDALNDKKAYVSELNFFDKVITMAIDDEYIEEAKEVLPLGESRKGKKSTANKAAKILYSTLMKNIPTEAFGKEKAKIPVEGKESSVTNYTFKVDQEDLAMIISNTANALKEDSAFLACYEDEKEIKSALNTIIDGADDLKDEEFELYVNVYLKGMTNSFAGLSIVKNDTYYDEQYIYEIAKTGKKTYELSYENSDDDGYVYESAGPVVVTVDKFKKDNMDIKVEYEIEDEGTVGFAITSNVKYNKTFDKNVSGKEVDIEELDEDDFDTIVENFENSELFKFADKAVENITGESLEDLISSMMDDDDYDDDDDDIDYSDRDYVETHNNKKVHFVIPSTFEFGYGSEAFMQFYKNQGDKRAGIEAWVLYYDSEEDFYESEKMEGSKYYTESDNYSNVKTSTPETVTVNGKTFTTFTNSYTYGSGNYSHDYKKIYYAYSVNEDDVYYLEIDGDVDIITQEEIEDFLTITIK